MYNTESEYFDAISKGDYKKPIVKCWRIQFAEVGKRARVNGIDHPASYLNKAPWIDTSPVVRIIKEGEAFETQNTIYVLDSYHDGKFKNYKNNLEV